MKKNIGTFDGIENRNEFKFKKTYLHMLEQLSNDNDKLQFLIAIINKQFKGIEPQLNGEAKFAYAAIKFHLDSSVEGYYTKTGNQPPMIDPIIPPIQGGYITPNEGPTQQKQILEQKEKREKKQKEKQSGNELGGFGKLLEVFPSTKVHSEHECLAIWDSLTQDEKKKVIKHSTVYVRELIKKNETQYMKNLKSYLESKIWDKVSISTKKKDYGRAMTKGGIDGKFVMWFGRYTDNQDFNKCINEIALLDDETYKEIYSIYQEELQNA